MKSAEVKCLHFHTTEISKPISSYQLYKGTLFEQIDETVDFVLSKLNRSVAYNKDRVSSDIIYEIPKSVLREAVVNAVAHRDYSSNASIQVMLFPDRLEIWNPGSLPEGITPETLRIPHASIPRNPLISDPLFLAHYIERAGTGTLDMIATCHKVGLPEPVFEQRGNQFVLTIWRNWLTESVLVKLDLNDRQSEAIKYVKEHGEISRKVYVSLFSISPRQALSDLTDLVEKRVFILCGKGRATRYKLHI
ncbi:MAG: ATP-binding protein [bacterium]